jgi:hypothetical protein
LSCCARPLQRPFVWPLVAVGELGDHATTSGQQPEGDPPTVAETAARVCGLVWDLVDPRVVVSASLAVDAA